MTVVVDVPPRSGWWTSITHIRDYHFVTRICVLAILWDAVTIPFLVAFASQSPPLIQLVNLVVDAWFVWDWILKLLEGVDRATNDDVDMDTSRVLSEQEKRNRRRMLLFDVLINLPPVGLGWILDLPPVWRLPRLLRLGYLMRYYQAWELRFHFNKVILRLAKLGSYIFLLIHWVACGYRLICEYEGFGSSLWVLPKVPGKGLGRLYIECFWWALSHMTGNTFSTPVSELQYMFTMMSTFLGVSVYCGLLGSMASIIANRDAAAQKFVEKLDSVNSYMDHQMLPPRLRDRINRYYQYQWKVHRGYDERAIFADLPDNLRTDVALFLNGDIIRRVPLFQDCDFAFLSRVVHALQPAMFAPSDFLMHIGEKDPTMYFLVQGRVDVLDANNEVIVSLNEGRYFGEISFFFGERRTASIIARTYCQTYRLERGDLDLILEDYPEYRQRIIDTALQRGIVDDAANPELKHTLARAHKSWTLKNLTAVLHDNEPGQLRDLDPISALTKLEARLDAHEYETEEDYSVRTRALLAALCKNPGLARVLEDLHASTQNDPLTKSDSVISMTTPSRPKKRTSVDRLAVSGSMPILNSSPGSGGKAEKKKPHPLSSPRGLKGSSPVHTPSRLSIGSPRVLAGSANSPRRRRSQSGSRSPRARAGSGPNSRRRKPSRSPDSTTFYPMSRSPDKDAWVPAHARILESGSESEEQESESRGKRHWNTVREAVFSDRSLCFLQPADTKNEKTNFNQTVRNLGMELRVYPDAVDEGPSSASSARSHFTPNPLAVSIHSENSAKSLTSEETQGEKSSSQRSFDPLSRSDGFALRGRHAHLSARKGYSFAQFGSIDEDMQGVPT